MDIWFTSDWHLNHRNIITYAKRPFRDVSQMNQELIERHNALVKPADLVIDVGDFSMNDKVVPWAIKQLHGRRRLIAGNHDRCFRRHRGWRGWAKQYEEWGFESVLQTYEMEMAGQTIRVEHMPYTEDIERHEKYKEYRPKDDGKVLLHGHVHQAWKQRDRMINVGCDVWDYRPVHFDELSKLVSDIVLVG